MDEPDKETLVLRARFLGFHKNFLTFAQYKKEDEAIFTFGVLTGMYTNPKLAGEPLAGDAFTLSAGHHQGDQRPRGDTGRGQHQLCRTEFPRYRQRQRRANGYQCGNREPPTSL